MSDREQTVRFYHRNHPQGDSRQRVLASLAQIPIIVCLLPVLLWAAADALLGYPSLLLYLYGGLPLALLLAVVWTNYQFRTVVVEVTVASPWVQVKTYADSFAEEPPPFAPPLDVRLAHNETYLTLTDQTYRFASSDWPSFNAMTEALRVARIQFVTQA